MKRLPLIIAALSLSVPLLQAKVYDITLTNATTYTQCHVKYRGSETKFIGTDEKGKVQTVVVPSSRILNMREVEEVEQPAPEPAKPAPTEIFTHKTPATPAPSTEPAPAAGDSAAPAEPAPSGDAAGKAATPADAPAAQPEPTGEEQAVDDGQAQNATLRLRNRLAEVDAAYATLRAPSNTLQRRVSNTRERIVKSLDMLDKQALTVAELQEKFNEAGRGGYTFDIVANDQRDQFQRDGEAAYNAMVVDMKEKPGARKVGGIDKYEILRERYQGIPQFKEAHEWYLRTLHDLDRKWTKMQANEKKRRNSLQQNKKDAMEKADGEQYDELCKMIEADGEDVMKVWFNPRPRNLIMLQKALNKVKVRLTEKNELTEDVGTVPALLEQFWQTMDQARHLMMEGQLEQADELLKNDSSNQKLSQLGRNVFPMEYRKSIQDQHKALEQEIQKRQRNTRNLKQKLEREAAQLERSTNNAEAQINLLMEEIQREQDLDSGENTVNMEESMNAPEGDDAAPDTAEAPKA